MPLLKRDAERCLNLLWECRALAEAEGNHQVYEKAISSLHAYLTDILPASSPCVRVKAEDGVVEIFPDQNAQIQTIKIYLDKDEKLGMVLDCIDVNGWSENASAASPIVISMLRPNFAAAKDSRLARGDQIVSINGHSLSKVSLQRAK